MANLKISARFLPNRPIQVNLEFHALFCTGFSFLTHVANFKKSNSYVERFDANFKQQHSCARFFAEVLPKTANRSFLDINDRTKQFSKIYSCASFFVQG